MLPKFRAWDKNNAYMEYTDKNLTVVFAQEGIQVVDHTTFSSSCTNMEDYVLMQSTGLKDINGTEIYEGDILKYRDEYRVVEMYDGAWIARTGEKRLIVKMTVLSGAEIIGNKFENRELLDYDSE